MSKQKKKRHNLLFDIKTDKTTKKALRKLQTRCLKLLVIFSSVDCEQKGHLCWLLNEAADTSLIYYITWI